MQNRIVLTGTPDDGIRLQSIMLFPTNRDLRDRWYTVTTLTNKLATMDIVKVVEGNILRRVNGEPFIRF